MEKLEFRSFVFRLGVAIGAMLFSSILPTQLAFAQQEDPTRERFLQPEEEPPAPVPEEEPILPRPKQVRPSVSPEGEQPQLRIPVRKIEVTGSTVFGAEQLDPITKPLSGRSVPLKELRSAADAITELYLNKGYITSRAVLAPQDVVDGVVQINVIEGQLTDIRVDGVHRLRTNYVRSRIERGADPPLRADRLEDKLRLLKINPLIGDIQASLQPGDEIGETRMIAEIKEANPFRINFNIDNYSPPSIGSERTGVALGYRNVTGFGDEIAGSFQRSITGDSKIGELSYRVPVNSMDGTFEFRSVLSRSEVSQNEFQALGIDSDTDLYEASFRQPLIRSIRQEFALSLGFSHQDGQTFLGDVGFGFGIGPEPDGTSRTSVIKFGQDYLRRDVHGIWALRSQFSFGVDMFDATTNSSPIPDGRFFSWLFQGQRVHRLFDNHLLISQGVLQLTPDSLLPSEQFVIGGGQTVRGYRQNARFGDNGFRFSMEDDITLKQGKKGTPIVQLAPFIDMGVIWNKSGNPNDALQPGQRFLASAGLGLLLEPLPGLNIRVDYAFPLVDLNDEGSNIQDDGLHFSVNFNPVESFGWL